MTNLDGWKRACAVFVLGSATAIASQAQTFASLVSFDRTNGAGPYGSVAQGADGSFYGTTTQGGGGCASGCGTIFKMAQGGTLTTAHHFNGADGSYPQPGLILAADGNAYGTTSEDGDGGTVFRITRRGTLATLHTFNGVDGSSPDAPLIQATDGNFYGTTSGGGTFGMGTIFRMSPAGTLTTLYNFAGSDGAYPIAGLIQATDGKLYGATVGGGDIDSDGTVFKITTGGALTTLHTFAGYPSDGSRPSAALVQGSDGNLYGTAFAGGAHDNGIVFKITTNGILTILHTFYFPIDGASPDASLIQATDGNFYGTTYEGGGGYGTIFTIASDGAMTTLHVFDSLDGAGSRAALVQGTTGTFYGTTATGGINNDGTVFSLDVGLGPFVTFVRAAGKVGQTGGILGQGFTGTTSVSVNGIQAAFTVRSDTYITATVPAGATTGYVTVTTPGGTLTSNVPFRVIP